MSDHQTERLLSLNETANQLSCSVVSVRRWIKSGKLPYVRIGRLLRVKRSDVAAWVTQGLSQDCKEAGGTR